MKWKFQDTQADHPIYNGCGDTKICFGSPDGCVNEKTCDALVTVLVEGERYIFEMQSRGAKYVAVGLSEDNKMVTMIVNYEPSFKFYFSNMKIFFTSSQGDDSVVECVNANDDVTIHMSWNPTFGEKPRNKRHPTVSKINPYVALKNTYSCVNSSVSKYNRLDIKVSGGRRDNVQIQPLQEHNDRGSIIWSRKPTVSSTFGCGRWSSRWGNEWNNVRMRKYIVWYFDSRRYWIPPSGRFFGRAKTPVRRERPGIVQRHSHTSSRSSHVGILDWYSIRGHAASKILSTNLG